MTLRKQVEEAFEARYGEPPSTVVWAPGRVNIIGGHTGYGGGYVLTATVDRGVMIGLRARDDGSVELHSMADDDTIAFDMESFEKSGSGLADLVKGAMWGLGSEGFVLRGWEGVLATDIPAGADLGADAALMLALLRAAAATSGLDYEPQPMANIADKAYTDFIGGRSMLPDLYSIALSGDDEVLLLDMQSLDIERMPFPREARFLLLGLGVDAKPGETERMVGERVDMFAIAARNYKVSHLRDLSMSRFEKDEENLDEDVAARARHFLTENGRTILAAEMMRSAALATVGKLMTDSHSSLRDVYGIGSEAADTMVAVTLEQPNVWGARWSGFGNAAVALVRDFSADTVSKLVPTAYKKASGNEGEAVVLGPAGSVSELS
jgi:galactokinase